MAAVCQEALDLWNSLDVVLTADRIALPVERLLHHRWLDRSLKKDRLLLEARLLNVPLELERTMANAGKAVTVSDKAVHSVFDVILAR